MTLAPISRALAGQLQLVEPAQAVAHRQAGERGQVAAGDQHVARRRVQPGAVAGGAGAGGDVAGEFLAHGGGVGLAIAPLHVRQDALEAAQLAAAALVGQLELELVGAAAVQHPLPGRLGQGLPGCLQVEAVVLGQGPDHLKVIAVASVPAADCAIGQTQFRMADDLGRVEELLDAEPVAGRAGPCRVVEREQPRFQLRDAVAADRAGEGGGEGDRFRVRLVHGRDAHDAAGELERGLDGLGQAQLQIAADAEAVDHDLDVVLLLEVQRWRVVQLVQIAVDARAHETLGIQFAEQVVVLALARRDHRRQQHQLLALGPGQDLIDHLADGLGIQRLAVFGAMRGADPGEQQAQIVVDLGDGADGGARVVRGGLLLDGDGRRQALDMVHVRLVHHRQELPRIGRQGLHIAPLALGIDGIEGQRRLAGAGQPGHHHQALPRQVQVDVLQVVRACTADADTVHVVWSMVALLSQPVGAAVTRHHQLWRSAARRFMRTR